MTASVSSAFWVVNARRVDEFVAKGHRRRRFFPHRIYHLPKCGPDGFKLAQAMCGGEDPAAMWEIVLYAEPAVLDGLPPDLFFDDDVIWHRQQFGLPGQVASANLVLDGGTVHAITMVSDLVQRISRRRELKTKVEKRFDGWRHMLLNAVLAFARERGVSQVRVATAELARRHTDRSRLVGFDLFDRIYDRTVNELVRARRDGDWWVIADSDLRDRAIVPELRTERRRGPQGVCVLHDVERGLGHVDVDPEFARQAASTAPGDLEEMRRLEADSGVRSTYCVVGSFLGEVRDGIESDGHSLAFHSFDHRLDRKDQLRRCREVDYRIKGYRPPRSVMTPELTNRNLLFHNFEWIASAPRSLGVSAPEMRAGVVRFPIVFDDYPLHRSALSYEEWEREALARITGSSFAAIGLHDCYAAHWLSHYPRFLERVSELGELRTLDEAAAEAILCSAA